MTERRVYVLIGFAIAVIAAAIWVSSQRHLPRDVDIGNKIFADLKLGEIREIDVSKAGAKRVATLEIKDNAWTVGERDQYPADATKVRALVIAIADLRIVEEKTAEPNNYPAISVEDIAQPTAGGTQIDLKGATTIASLIVGRNSGGRSSFVRKPGNARSYLAAPQVFADPEPKNWLHRPIVDIASARVQEARVTAAKVSYVLTRKDRSQANFALESVPKGKALASDMAGNAAGTALSGLELDDVRKQDTARWNAPAEHAEIRTFDGWVVGIEGLIEGDQHWIRLTSRYDEALAKTFAPPAGAAASKDAKPQPDVRKDSAGLASRAAGWEFEVPKYKYDALFKPLDEIVKKP